MTRIRRVRLPPRRVWLRVAEPEWTDPLDASFAAAEGGRWNPPNSFPTLYLNGDISTARLQLQRLVEDTPVDFDDLDDAAYVLVAATLPRDQTCADGVTPAGLEALGLPSTYPRDSGGEPISRRRCQAVGERVRAAALRGVWCTSAVTRDGGGRELAWFPATRRSRARAVWEEPLPLGEWREASSWSDVGLGDQEEPRP